MEHFIDGLQFGAGLFIGIVVVIAVIGIIVEHGTYRGWWGI